MCVLGMWGLFLQIRISVLFYRRLHYRLNISFALKQEQKDNYVDNGGDPLVNGEYLVTTISHVHH